MFYLSSLWERARRQLVMTRERPMEPLASGSMCTSHPASECPDAGTR